MSKKIIKNIGKKAFPSIVNRLNHISDSLASIKSDTNHTAKLLNISDTKLIQLRALHEQSDPYQPLYGVNGIGEIQRSSKDRCEALLKHFDNNVKGMRVLDIGCYFGYISFYLADRGAIVDGWDNNGLNIEIANKVKEINGIDASFFTKEFNPESIKAIPEGKYDVVLIYSVLHWLVALYGLDYVQECMSLLFEKVPVVILELAQKGEDKKLYWDKAVPKNDLDILNKVGGYNVHKMGDFPTHLSGKHRPIYVISKNHVVVNNHNYPVEKIDTTAYKGAEHWRGVSAQYYKGKQYFIKKMSVSGPDDESRRSGINEINFYLQNSSIHNHSPITGVPKLKDYEINSDSTILVLENIEGELLSDCIKTFNLKEKESITKSLLKTVAELEKKGLYHNDLRTWNVMISPKKNPVLIDMELCGSVEIEDNTVAFAWLISSLLSGEKTTATRNKNTMPDGSVFNQSEYFKNLYKNLATMKMTFTELSKVSQQK